MSDTKNKPSDNTDYTFHYENIIYSEQDLTRIILENRAYKMTQTIRSIRPISLPENLTIAEYNWLVDKLKTEREKILKAKHAIHEKIKDNATEKSNEEK